MLIGSCFITGAIRAQEQIEKSSSALHEESDSNHLNSTHSADNEQSIDPQSSVNNETEEEEGPRTIRQIFITGNKQISTQALLNKIPYKLGEVFDPRKSGSLLRNLYALGYFRYIELLGEDIGKDQIDLHIAIIEKHKLEEVKYVGNDHLSSRDIAKKIDFSKIPAVDEEELSKFSKIIQQIYIDKGYHFTKIVPTMTVDESDKATVTFTVEEGPQSVVKQIFFKGNNRIDDKQLRAVLFTREDWLLSFMDNAGMFHPDALEQDKYTLETFYRNHGYLVAKVTHVDIDMDPKSKNFYITFHIDEGDTYTIKDITIPGNDILSEDELLRALPLKKGMLFSQNKLQKSLEIVRMLWGEHGYIFADVDQSIQVNEEEKSVSIAFYSDLGSKVRLNRINIIGNAKSRDAIIRRQIVLDEGDLLTTQKMEFSKNRVELLGYFDKRNGVNWKMNRISDDLCDLDLILKEVRTGTATLQAGTRGSGFDIQNPSEAFTVSFGFADTNFLGRGIQYDVAAALAKTEQSGHLNIVNPWLFNKPISGAVNIFASNVTYDDLRSVTRRVNEFRSGGSGGLGFFLKTPRDAHIQCQAGAENILYRNPPIANAENPVEQLEFQAILNRRFQSGMLIWVTNAINQDMRNHPMHPSHGYRWYGNVKVGFAGDKIFRPNINNTIGQTQCCQPNCTNPSHPICPDPQGNRTCCPPAANFGFVKFEADGAWYTPLIGESDLVLCTHGHFGIVHAFDKKTIPYRELFHIGGPATVRGFLFGQISPSWINDSIGATKAFWVNAELVFPIKPDFSIKGALFYDGGAGWDTPDSDCINPIRLRNNRFNYRHAIGIGVRLLNPAPMQVDWGFKLDRNKKIGEPVAEMHLTMQHNF